MLIAIAGAIGSGKSTVAERLADSYGFRVVTFADALREEVMARLPRTLRAMHDDESSNGGPCQCRSLTGWTGDAAVDETRARCVRAMVYESKPPTFRALLQEYGSDVRRADDPDYWVKRWAEKARHLPGMAPVVSPDCRFPNEARAVRAMGGQLWRVERPGCVGTGHVSETALAHWFDYDAVLVNDGTLAELYMEIERRLRPPTCAQGDGAWL